MRTLPPFFYFSLAPTDRLLRLHQARVQGFTEIPFLVLVGEFNAEDIHDLTPILKVGGAESTLLDYYHGSLC